MSILNSLVQYLHLGDVARGIRDGLAYRLVAPEVALPESTHRAFSEGLEHLGQVREGFVVSLRTSPASPSVELHMLVRAELFDWESIRQLLGFDFQAADWIEIPSAQLLAFAHSYVTFASIPYLPPQQVTYPAPRRTYNDIHAPRTAGEVFERIEEMEAVVSRMEREGSERVDRGRLRRTYGFFETSAWLVALHTAKFAKQTASH